MSGQDIIQILIAFLAIAVLFVLAAVLPIYRVGQGSYVRRFIWNPPVQKVGHPETRMSEKQKEQVVKDPRSRRIIEKMQQMPNEIACPPIFLGPRWGPGRNWLGALALYSSIAFGGFVVFKWANRG